MRSKFAFSSLFAFILLVGTFVSAGVPAARPTAQNPTQQQQTVDAAISGFFNQTATAQSRLDVTATAQAGSGLTATAAEQQRLIALTATIDAAFSDALTATAAVQTPNSAPATPLASSSPFINPTVIIDPDIVSVASPVVRIPAASFMMGTTAQEIQGAVRECLERDAGDCQLIFGEDSVPQHTVTLDAYAMEVTEVSFRQYLAFLNAGAMGAGSHRDGCFGFLCVETQDEEANSYIQFDGETYSIAPLAEGLPVVNVTWYGANAYCAALGRRLPTEAEWEYAARGDEGFIYPWGSQWQFGLAKTNRPASDPIGAVEVDSFASGASPFGVLNMAGNVAEWVFDYYGDRYYFDSPEINPTGPTSGETRVIRGGSWDAAPFFARAVHRQSFPSERGSAAIGFRCVEGAPLTPEIFARPNFDLTPSQTAPTATLTPTPR